MNKFCEKCELRKANTCSISTEGSASVHHITYCPEGRWKTEPKPQPRKDNLVKLRELLKQPLPKDLPPLKLLWISGDMAQGGCTRYMLDAIRILRYTPITHRVVWFQDHHYYPFVENEVKKYAEVQRYSPERFADWADWADVITSINYNKFCTNHPQVLTKASPKLFCQIHGTCSYAVGIYNDHRAYTKLFLGCSKRAATVVKDDEIVCTPPVPIDFERLVRQRSKLEARRFLDLDPSDKLICYAGRIAPEKGLIRGAEAVASLPPEYKYFVVGNGYGEKDILPKLRQILGKRLIHLPWVDRPTDYLDACDCFLITSDWEGVPMVLVEALIHGTPMISVDVGVAKEYVIYPPNKMPYYAVIQYQSPKDIVHACTFTDPTQRLEIIESVRLSHSDAQIATETNRWLYALKELFRA